MFCAARQFVAWAFLAALLGLLLPAPAAAQEPVKSFDQLNTRLKVGDTVWVTDAQGREVKGRITSFGPAAIGVDANGAQVLRADEIRAVEHRRRDSLWNGALIGFGVGLGAGAATLPWACSDSCSGVGQGVLIGFLMGGIGAGIGIGVDAAIPGRRQIVYRAGTASPSARLSLVPLITPRTKALAVSLSF